MVTLSDFQGIQLENNKSFEILMFSFYPITNT